MIANIAGDVCLALYPLVGGFPRKTGARLVEKHCSLGGYTLGRGDSGPEVPDIPIPGRSLVVG